MADYKKMYHEMVRETEKAINILIAAQRRCEEMYISAPEPEITSSPKRNGLRQYSAIAQKSPAS